MSNAVTVRLILGTVTVVETGLLLAYCLDKFNNNIVLFRVVICPFEMVLDNRPGNRNTRTYGFWRVTA